MIYKAGVSNKVVNKCIPKGTACLGTLILFKSLESLAKVMLGLCHVFPVGCETVASYYGILGGC